MPSKILGENVRFTIEIEDKPKSILLVFDRKCDVAIVPYQDAYNLAAVMEQVITDVKAEFGDATDRDVVESEQAQIRLVHHNELVAIVVEWTDRLRFTTWEAFYLVLNALKKCAQDAQLSAKGVHIRYDRNGMISKIHNKRLGHTQNVR